MFRFHKNKLGIKVLAHIKRCRGRYYSVTFFCSCYHIHSLGCENEESRGELITKQPELDDRIEFLRSKLETRIPVL